MQRQPDISSFKAAHIKAALFTSLKQAAYFKVDHLPSRIYAPTATSCTFAILAQRLDE